MTEIRSFRDGDAAALDGLVLEAWSADPALARISSIHGAEADGECVRRTLVAVDGDRPVGTATVLGSARHPTRLFAVVAVAEHARRRGVGSTLLARLPRDGRPLLARVREADEEGLGFARAHGFDVVMRSRTGVVDPNGEAVRRWERAAPTDVAVVSGAARREEVARAHEEAYARDHATWSPVSVRPPAESLEVFCGESWLAASALLARGGVASLHGPPLAERPDELALVAGTTDDRTLRALVARELAFARAAGKKVSIEADEAMTALWRILEELPARLEPDLLLLADG